MGTPWLALMASLPGLAALVALVFTWVSVGQTGTELRIAEQGQITTRFNAAVAHLGSQSLDLRLGGIYALERIMQDSPRDQPRVVTVLSAYVRTHTPVPAGGPPAMDSAEIPPPPDADVAAATDVLAERPLGKDGRARVSWQEADLRNMRLQSRNAKNRADLPAHVSLSFADLRLADLRRSVFEGVDLHGATCSGANMAFVYFSDVNLEDAMMASVDLTGASLKDVNLRGAYLARATLSDAELTRTHLSNANLSNADLSNADLSNANLSGADLSNADLKGANLTGADLHLADLRGADLTGADLTEANLDEARGVPAELLKK